MELFTFCYETVFFCLFCSLIIDYNLLVSPLNSEILLRCTRCRLAFLLSKIFSRNVERHSSESSLHFHCSIVHISLRPLTIKHRAIALIQRVDTEDEPSSEYVLRKRTSWDLKTQERYLRALTVWHNDSYHFAFKAGKCVFWLPSSVASDFNLTCNKALFICCLGKEHTGV